MASLNKVQLIGNLGADPESRYMPNGDAVCNIRLATTETWKDKATGEKKEASEWHRVVFFKRLAEIAGEHLKKGAPVYVEGTIKTRKWQNKDGVDQYTTEIHAHEMKMLGKRDSESSQKSQQQSRQGSAPPPAGDFEDDCPFAAHARGIAGYSM